MAHAVHPNYSERHEDHHQPKLHEGLVIKHNASQRYATNAVTAFLFKEVAKAKAIPTQVRFYLFEESVNMYTCHLLGVHS